MGYVDAPLEPIGVKDAKEAAKFLEGTEPVFLVSSDKKRAVQTASVFEKEFNLENIPTEQLRAWDIGEFSGKDRSKENIESVEKYVNNPDIPIPGGESLQEFRDRITPVLEECFLHACDNGVGFIVAHSSVVHEAGSIIKGSHTALLVEPGGIIVLGIEDGKLAAEQIFKPAKVSEQDETVS